MTEINDKDQPGTSIHWAQKTSYTKLHDTKKPRETVSEIFESNRQQLYLDTSQIAERCDHFSTQSQYPSALYTDFQDMCPTAEEII